MNARDIDRIHAAGLIDTRQRDAILAHFGLEDEKNKLLQIISILGGLLVSGGILLIIASNWDSIPRLVRIGMGVALMLGAHWGGLRLGAAGPGGSHARHPVLAATLHLIGSMLFLANIALVGQIYHLSSRFPNALLLWLVGIAPLPWVLRSKSQFILFLAAFGVWMGAEMGHDDGWLKFGGDARLILFFGILGLAFVGWGHILRRTGFAEFGPASEKFGMLTFHIASFPLTLGFLYGAKEVTSLGSMLSIGASVMAGLALVFGVLRSPAIESRQWRMAWCGILCGLLGLSLFGIWVKTEDAWNSHGHSGPHWVTLPLLIGVCLIQAQVGLLMRSPFLLNLAVTFIGIHLVSAYLQLFGTMFDTGLVFLTGGVLLILLSIFLERQRRKWMRRMQATPPSPNP